MEVREVEVVGYSPWIGESGNVEGALVRSNDECLLLTGDPRLVAQLLGMKPTRKSRASASSNGQREPVASPVGDDLLCPDDPQCGFVGKNRLSLGIHRSKVHGFKGAKKLAAETAKKPAKRRAKKPAKRRAA